MATFRVRKIVTETYEAYIEAEDWEDAEEKARYDTDVEWRDTTDYTDEEYDVDEED